MMKRLIVSLQFLTIIPWNNNLKMSEEDLGKSMLYFPLIGLLIGGSLAGLHYLLTFVLPQSIVDVLMVTFLVLITGSIHLDALADTIDGIASGKDRNEKLRIMKESSVGAMGVVAIVLDLLIKYLALTVLPATSKTQSLLVMPMMGRWSQVIVAYFSNYAGLEKGLGFPFTEHVSMSALLGATMMTLGCAFWLLLFKGIVITGTIALLTFLGILFFKRSLGGITGDVLGAVNEFTEVAVLILILAAF